MSGDTVRAPASVELVRVGSGSTEACSPEENLTIRASDAAGVAGAMLLMLRRPLLMGTLPSPRARPPSPTAPFARRTQRTTWAMPTASRFARRASGARIVGCASARAATFARAARSTRTTPPSASARRGAATNTMTITARAASVALARSVRGRPRRRLRRLHPRRPLQWDEEVWTPRPV